MSPADLPPDERRRRGTKLCGRLAADVARVAPPRIGGWAEAWEMTAEADAAFWIALVAWESEPTEPARLRLRDAYNAVLDAWREAARQYNALRQEADL